jgi:hypothetical protein
MRKNFTSCNKMKCVLISLCSIILCSCINNRETANNKKLKRNSNIYDTIEQKTLIVAKSKMPCTGFIFSDTTVGLNLEIDTLELIDMRFACDCPNWFDSLNYSKNNLDNSNIDRIDFNSKLFKEQCYYLEPAENSINISSISFLPRTRIKLIGRKYYKQKLPIGNLLQDPNPIIGKVFRYYGFEIMKPFKVYSNEFKKIMENPELEVEENLLTITIK